MKEILKQKVSLFTEKFGEAWLACLLAMVQGDITVISWYHAFVASKTGALTGIAIVLTSFFKRIDNMWGAACMTGVVTAIADIMIHPTHFGPEWAEAVVTGIGAGALCIIYHNFRKRLNETTQS